MKKSNQKQLSYAEAQAALNKLIEALQSEQIPWRSYRSSMQRPWS
ncbi:hypothetical protein AAF134_12800 [Synechococcus lacustris Tous-12m]